MSTCSVQDCDRPAKGKRDWCAMHTERWRRWGDPTETRPRTRAACGIDDCDRGNEARGWCALHYRRWRDHGDPLWEPVAERVRTPELTRLMRHVDQSGGPDACWPWQGHRTFRGYGTTFVHRNGRQVTTSAHRAVYQAHKGDLPPDVFVLHGCHNPPCCNPAHLRPGSHRENMADRMYEGAGYPRGNENPTAVQISDEAVASIRAEYRLGVKGRGQHALAARYGLSRSEVQRIVTRTDRWKGSAV